jgi:hypothetical protein
MSSVSRIRPHSTETIVVSTCPDCRRHGTLRLVRHPAGDVLVCRRCLGAHRQTAAAPGGADKVRTAAACPRRPAILTIGDHLRRAGRGAVTAGTAAADLDEPRPDALGGASIVIARVERAAVHSTTR